MRDPTEIGYESFGVETDSSIGALESRVGVLLPQGLRHWLLRVGGGYLADCCIACRYPTPFADHNVTMINSVDDILWGVDSEIIPRNMLCIGVGHLGLWTCISIAGVDHGKIYAFDAEMRFFWSADRIRCMPSLDPEVREFFRRRDNDDLPPRPWGYENCYEVADSFEDLLKRLTVEV